MGAERPRPAYGRDLAWVHNTGFGDVARTAAPGLLRLLRRAGIRDGRVVDLGCGSGIWARALTDAGYDVTGIDISPDMIRLAQKHAPRATFRCASFFDAHLLACEAVTAIGECFSYALDPKSGSRELARLFHRIGRALRGDGVLIFDILESHRTRAGAIRQTYRDTPEWTVCVAVSEDPAHRALTRDITLFRRVGTLYRRSEERHVLHLYDLAEVTAALEGAGFRFRRLRGYGSLRFRARQVGFLATRQT